MKTQLISAVFLALAFVGGAQAQSVKPVASAQPDVVLFASTTHIPYVASISKHDGKVETQMKTVWSGVRFVKRGGNCIIESSVVTFKSDETDVGALNQPVTQESSQEVACPPDSGTTFRVG